MNSNSNNNNNIYNYSLGSLFGNVLDINDIDNWIYSVDDKENKNIKIDHTSIKLKNESKIKMNESDIVTNKTLIETNESDNMINETFLKTSETIIKKNESNIVMNSESEIKIDNVENKEKIIFKDHPKNIKNIKNEEDENTFTKKKSIYQEIQESRQKKLKDARDKCLEKRSRTYVYFFSYFALSNMINTHIYIGKT